MTATPTNTSGDPGRSTRRRYGTAVLVVSMLLAACAGTAFHRVVDTGHLLPVVAVAAGAPTLLVGLVSAGRRRLSLWLSAPLSAVCWLFAVAATVLRRDATAGFLPSRATLADAGTGLRDGWLQMLTAILPAPPTPHLLLAVQVSVWLAAAVAAEFAVRTRSALLPALPPLALFAAGVLVGVTGPGSNLPAAAGFIVLTVVLLAIRQPNGVHPVAGAATLVRRYLAAVPMLAAVLLAATLAGPHLPGLTGRQPFDLRQHITPAGAPRPALNPLDQVSAWLATPNLVLFTVRATASADWRIATLDEFDGETWRASGRFVSTAWRVPAPGVTSARSSRLDQGVSIGALTGDWLPAAEAPIAVTGADSLVDPGTGVVLSDAGLHTGMRYNVVSQLPEYDEAELRRATPATDAAARTALALPAGLPASIETEAEQATAGATFPFQQATRLETYLRSHETNDSTNATPGHTYGHLRYFLDVSHRGTSEQFATAFAVMARSIGLPTRIAVGFAPGRSTPGGTWVVSGRDALVWPEVDFRGLGWVPFFPTPAAITDSAAAIPAGATSRRQQVDASLNATALTAPAPPPASTTKHPPVTGTRVTARTGGEWWPLLLLAAGLAVGYLGTVVLVPLVRRRRRQAAAGATARVAAAWAEATAQLRPLRLGPLNASTTGEIADAAGRRLTPEAHAHLRELAALADVAVFSDATLDSAAATAAWRHVHALRRPIRRAVRRRTALWYRLSPAALRG